MGPAKIYVNGRFLSQPLTGVQRFGTEITAALQRIHGRKVSILVPSSAPEVGGGIRPIDRRYGHLWEQLVLPRLAKDGILVNLCNTAPLRVQRQIIVVHDTGFIANPKSYSWQFRALYAFQQRWAVRSGARVVTVSDFSRSEIIRNLGATADDVTVVSEGADHMDRIVSEPQVLTRTGLTPGRFVLAVGSLSPHKNLSSLGDLVSALGKRDMRLVITGGLAPGVFQSSGYAGLPADAQHIGRVSDGELKALYQSAACFVFPSHYEGFGLPAIEAMACGCLVAAADIPALRETCGDAAIYFPPSSPSDIAAQVCRILDDDQNARRLRAAATSHVSAYTWDVAAAALDRVITAYWECHGKARGCFSTRHLDI